MTIGDGIRRHVALISQTERDRLPAAFLALDTSLIYPSMATITAYLSEYGLPVEHRARTVAHIAGPVGAQMLPMTEDDPGVFTLTFPTPVPGTYQIRVVADGLTLRDAPFTREQLRAAVGIAGGDNPPPADPGGRGSCGCHELCDLLDCLTEVGGKFLTRNGISPNELRRCIGPLLAQLNRSREMVPAGR